MRREILDLALGKRYPENFIPGYIIIVLLTSFAQTIKNHTTLKEITIVRAKMTEPPALILSLDWSDGTTTWQDGVNGPTEEMLDNTPDEKGNQDFLRPIEPYSKKEISWLCKMAGWLVESKDPEMYKQYKSKKICLKSLPENYRLYEHVKLPGPVSFPISHAAFGSHTYLRSQGTEGKARIDTYLYGHPKGPRKRYRSAADFQPHFVWMATDPNRNPENCRCRVCSGRAPPDTPEPPNSPTPLRNIPAATAREKPVPVSKGIPATRSVFAASTGTSTRRTTSTPATLPLTRRSLSTTVNSRSSTPVTTPAPAPIPPPVPTPVAPILPTPPPFPAHLLESSPTVVERSLHAAPGPHVFRPGELVWCQCTEAWSLGIIVSGPETGPSQSSNNSQQQQSYTVQVLKSPLESEMSTPYPGITVASLRPWLAWSTPDLNNAPLRAILTYDDVVWEQYRGVRGLEVDASIMKSRDIDSSYNLIDRLDYPNGNFYAGVYYGAEKLWIGDAVRLKRHAAPNLMTGLEIMVITSIQDTRMQPSTGISRPVTTDVTVLGDIYTLLSYPASPASAAPSPLIPEWLPQRLVRETTFRNRVTSSNPQQPIVSTWKLLHAGHTIKLEDIKGRWYESSLLIPYLKGREIFNQTLQSGIWDEVATQMNEMGNAGQATSRGWCRTGKRDDVLTTSVPRGFSLEKGGIEVGMEGLALQQSHNTHHLLQNTHRDMVDLTGDDDESGAVQQEQSRIGAYGLEEGEDLEDDEAFMRQMQLDVASFLKDPGDSFYGSL